MSIAFDVSKYPPLKDRRQEKLTSVAAAVRRVTGTSPHPSTLHRWRQRGIRGVVLETVRVGGRRMSSVEAVERFIAATTVAVDGTTTDTTPRRTSRQREAAIAAAERELRDACI